MCVPLRRQTNDATCSGHEHRGNSDFYGRAEDGSDEFCIGCAAALNFLGFQGLKLPYFYYQICCYEIFTRLRRLGYIPAMYLSFQSLALRLVVADLADEMGAAVCAARNTKS